MGYDLYYKDKKEGTTHYQGYKSTIEQADKWVKDSERIARTWECNNRYDYYYTKVEK